MGWWGKFRSECPQGKDRIQAVIEDEKKNCESKDYKWEVIDSSLHGTTVYFATRRTNKTTGESVVYAEVCLTSYHQKDGCFMIKSMSDDMHPYYYDCPKHILDKLTAPYNDSAKEWREKCEAKRVKRQQNEILKLPLGAKIRLKNYRKEGEWILEVCKYRGRRSYIDWTHRTRFYPSHIERYGWEVVS